MARPFWGGAGIWAVLCGALAARGLQWNADDLWTLALVLLLAELGWGSLWDLATNSNWQQALAADRQLRQKTRAVWLPYTLPGSPGGRLFGGFGRLAGWWQETFWPAAGAALLGSVAAALLVVALGLLLPDSLRLLNAALVALLGLGLWQRRWGRAPLMGGALVQVCLGWLAGHLAFAPVDGASLVPALAFAASVWGGMRLQGDLPRALWLLDGGQVAIVALLAAQKQPLAAFAAGMLLLGQAALQPGLATGQDRGQVLRRTWPWLMATMLLAALALP